MQSLLSLPTHRKPRERLLSQEGEALAINELIAVIIGTGGHGCGVMEVANSISELLNQGCVSASRLQAIPGVGQSKALRIIAALQLTAALKQHDTCVLLNDPKSVYEAMEDLTAMPQEHLVVFYVTVRQTKLQRELISLGTLTASLVHPREVYRGAILNNAASIVLAHNHPSGYCQPSAADLHATRLISEAGKVLGIELLDHVVCSKTQYISIRNDYPELFV